MPLGSTKGHQAPHIPTDEGFNDAPQQDSWPDVFEFHIRHLDDQIPVKPCPFNCARPLGG